MSSLQPRPAKDAFLQMLGRSQGWADPTAFRKALSLPFSTSPSSRSCLLLLVPLLSEAPTCFPVWADWVTLGS